MFQLDV